MSRRGTWEKWQDYKSNTRPRDNQRSGSRSNYQGQIIGDLDREHQQDKTAGAHREMDLKIEVTRKSLQKTE